MYLASDLRYDPGEHRSWRPDGVEVPHVTAVLEAVGVSEDFGALRQRSARLAAQIDLATERGSAVHADCHAYDDDDLMWETVDRRVRPFVDAWVQVRREHGLEPLAHARERRVYHPHDNYTGILDGVFLRRLGPELVQRVLVDIKTGDPESAAAHLQTAAYAAAWDAEHPDEPIHERWAVWLRPGRRVPYTIVNYTSATRSDHYLDYSRWAACLVVYHEQPARRRRIAA